MPEIQNDYYSIAVNDYQFLAAALHTGLYNQISGGEIFQSSRNKNANCVYPLCMMFSTK